MSLNGKLHAHWGRHKQAQAVHNVKTRLTNLSETLKGNVAAINEIMASEVFEEVDSEIVDEMLAMVDHYSACLLALDSHTVFLTWKPPN